MAPDTFADFEVWVGATGTTAADTSVVFPSRVILSPAGPAFAELKLPLDAEEFQQALAVVRGIDGDLDTRRSFGERLFRSLFDGDAGRVWNETLGMVNAGAATGVRLRLWIDAPQLALLPWELLYDPGRKEFLSTTANMVMSRYLPVPEPPLLAAHQRLRVLVVVESPPGPPPVTDEEVNRLTAAIGKAGKVIDTPRVLRNAPARDIQSALQQEYHVVHYLGHGRDRHLVLTGEDGKLDPIDDRALATLFRGRRTLRLVVLSACHSSQSEEGGVFAGIGPALVEARIPAVIAMQYPTVQLDTAGKFNDAFYGALVNGIPVDAAVNEARQAIAGGPLLDGRDWSTPVLYMGTRTGRLFNFESTEKTEVERAWQALEAAGEESAQTKAALSTLIERFRQVSAAQRHVQSLNEMDRLLGDLRLGLQVIDRIAARAGGLGPNLLPYLPELMAAWTDFRQTRLEPLRAFVAAHPELDTGRWFPSLDAAARQVDDHIARDQALRPLAERTSLGALGAEIARADASLKGAAGVTLADLVALSDRTLGAIADG